MVPFIAIFKKELRELVNRDLVVSLIFMIVLFVFIGRIGRDIDRELAVGIYCPTGFSFPLHKEEYEIISAPSVEEALTEAKGKDMDLLLALPRDWHENLHQGVEIDLYWLVGDFSIGSQISQAKVRTLFHHLNREVSRSIIEDIAPGRDPEQVVSPITTRDILVIKDRVLEGSPDILRGLVSQQSMIIPMVLMMVIIYAGTLVITSMGLEKEGKTLETLLTLPISRRSIITGKMAGSASIALLMTVVFMVGFRYYMDAFIPVGGGVHLSQFGIEMTKGGFILLGVSMFLSIVSALILAIILGTFAQDTKSAQALIMPIVFLIMVPFVVNMFKGIENLPVFPRTLLYLIPFTHSIIASQALLFREYVPVMQGIVYKIAFISILVLVATKMFERDILLLGWRIRWKRQ